MTHYYVTDASNRVLSEAHNSPEAAGEEGAAIRERTGVETFVRSGLWTSWTGAPTVRAVSRRERGAAVEDATARALAAREAEDVDDEV